MLAAILGRFVAVEVQQHLRDGLQCAAHIGDAGVDEQPDRHHERREPSRQLDGAAQADPARAHFIQHKADRVGAGLHRGVNIGLAGQAADLDAGSLIHGKRRLQGNQSMADVWAGMSRDAS